MKSNIKFYLTTVIDFCKIYIRIAINNYLKSMYDLYINIYKSKKTSFILFLHFLRKLNLYYINEKIKGAATEITLTNFFYKFLL